MFDKFKNLIGKGGGGKTEKEEPTVVVADDQDPKSQMPNESADADQNAKTLFDEMLGAPQYTYEEFLEVLQAPNEERGDTEELRKHWGYPRRWKVILWDLQIQNYMSNTFNAFIDFDFGGNREECHIQRGSAMKIYAKGKTKNNLRTKVVSNVISEEKKNMDFRNVFEYRGSYLDLENEKIRIKVWEYKQFTLNKLEGIYEEPLLSFAVGEVYNETTLYKFIKDTRVKRCHLCFQLYFQELYDFELSFLNWSFSDLLSAATMKKKSFVYLMETDPNNKKLTESTKLAFLPCFQRNKGFNNFSKIRKSLQDKDSFNKNVSFKTDFSEEDVAFDPKEEITRNLENLLVRNLSLIYNIDETEELLTNDKEYMLPNPRVTIELTHTPKGSEGLNLVSIEQKQINYPVWENLGELYFRGTLRDLDISYLSIKVEDMSAPKANREIGCCQIPLKGVVDYPYIMNDLEPPSWLVEDAKSEGWYKKLEEWKLGSVEGKVIIERVPRYRQIGDIYHVDHKHYYLIVNILNIDQIVTIDNVKELDTYVEVTFDRTSRRTKMLKRTLTPEYDSLIAIPLRFNNKNEVSFHNFCRKGRIHIDVWGRTEDPIYIGGCIINPYDIFFNEKNLARPSTKLEHVDLESNVKILYDAIVYKGSRQLHYLHDDQRISNINFSIWTYPNILNVEEMKNITSPPPFSTTTYFPVQFAKKYDKLKNLYIDVLKTTHAIPQSLTNIETSKRYFTYELKNQRKESHFLPTLLTGIKSPFLAESTNAVFHYVRCIPFIRKQENIAFTPEFTLQLKGGNALDHCLLLCSLFLGVPTVAFVCFGTLWDNQKHSWVTTFEVHEEKNYGIVKFWETTTGNVYVLKKRFLDTNKLKGIEIKLNESKYKAHLRDGFLQKQKKAPSSKQALIEEAKRNIKTALRKRNTEGTPQGGPLLPYKTIDLIFNNKNIYVNLQSHDPLNIWYDFWRIDLWYPFTTVDYKIQPCFTIKSFTHKMEDMELDRIIKELRSSIEKNITNFRASRNLATRWNRDETLELFLQIGLELLHQLNTARNEDILLAKVKIEDWKKALYYKVPQSHRILGFPYHFNTCKPKFIADKLISTLAILESRDRSLCLSFAVCMYSLPGDFVSVYIYIITCVKITQRELKKMEIAKEKAQRKAEHKKLKKEQAMNKEKNKMSMEVQKETPGEIEEIEQPKMDDDEDAELHKLKKKKSKSKDKKNKKSSKHSPVDGIVDDTIDEEKNLSDKERNKKNRMNSLNVADIDMKNVEEDKIEGAVDESNSVKRAFGAELNGQEYTLNITGVEGETKEEKKLRKKNSTKKKKSKKNGDTNELLSHHQEIDLLDKMEEEGEGEVEAEIAEVEGEAEISESEQEGKEKKKKKHKMKKSISFGHSSQVNNEKSPHDNTKLLGILKKSKDKSPEIEEENEKKKKKKKKELQEEHTQNIAASKEIMNLEKENFEKEKLRLREEMEKLQREKEEFQRKKLLREEKEKRKLLEQKEKLKKEREQFKLEKMQREQSLLLKTEKMEKQIDKKIKEKLKEKEKMKIQKILEKESEEKKRLQEEREFLKRQILEKEKEKEMLENEKRKEKQKLEMEIEREKKRLELEIEKEKKRLEMEIVKQKEQEKKKMEEEWIQKSELEKIKHRIEEEKQIQEEMERKERERKRELQEMEQRKLREAKLLLEREQRRLKQEMEERQRKLDSFDEEIDLNQSYIKKQKSQKNNQVVQERKKIRLFNKDDNNSVTSSTVEDKRREPTVYTEKNENIAKMLYQKAKNDSTGMKNYDYSRVYRGNSNHMNSSFSDIKNADLFKGFIKETNAKKRIMLVHKGR